MEGLQRSSETFRRSGSSGMVWEDRFAPAGWDDNKKKEDSTNESADVVLRIERSQSAGEGRAGADGYRAGRAPAPVMDPPSPRVSVCGFCSFFAKPPPPTNPSKPRRHR